MWTFTGKLYVEPRCETFLGNLIIWNLCGTWALQSVETIYVELWGWQDPKLFIKTNVWTTAEDPEVWIFHCWETFFNLITGNARLDAHVLCTSQAILGLPQGILQILKTRQWNASGKKGLGLFSILLSCSLPNFQDDLLIEAKNNQVLFGATRWKNQSLSPIAFSKNKMQPEREKQHEPIGEEKHPEAERKLTTSKHRRESSLPATGLFLHSCELGRGMLTNLSEQPVTYHVCLVSSPPPR